MAWLLALGSGGLAPAPDDQGSPAITWTVISVPRTWQGDAHLLTDGTTNVLIDTGAPDSTEAVVVPFLNERGIGRLDYVFLSHAHIDHAEGIGVLADHVDIGVIVFAPLPDACAADDPGSCNPARLQAALDIATSRGARLVAPEPGMAWTFGPRFWIMIVDAAAVSESRPDVNSYSIIMRAHMNGTTALFTGDMTTWQALALRPEKADILKLPHHGLDTQLSSAWEAGITVASVTADLWCGPRAVSLRSRFPETYVTGLHGEITLAIDDGVVVSTERSGRC